MAVMSKVRVSLGLPESWFVIPATLESDAEIAEWANETAYRAWRLRADAGVPEEAVSPGAGERLVVELAGLAANLRQQVDVAAGDFAAVWLPVPELGVLNAVVIVRSAARTGERTVENFADALAAAAETAVEGHAQLNSQRLEAELPAGPVRGVHSMLAVAQPDGGLAALEERTWLGVFPSAHADVMVEVLFIAERVASFDDMPAETLALLGNLEIDVEEAA